MWSIRKLAMTGVAIIAAGSAWHAKSLAQESAASGAGVATVYDHTNMDASFANVLATEAPRCSGAAHRAMAHPT